MRRRWDPRDREPILGVAPAGLAWTFLSGNRANSSNSGVAPTVGLPPSNSPSCAQPRSPRARASARRRASASPWCGPDRLFSRIIDARPAEVLALGAGAGDAGRRGRARRRCCVQIARTRRASETRPGRRGLLCRRPADVGRGRTRLPGDRLREKAHGVGGDGGLQRIGVADRDGLEQTDAALKGRRPKGPMTLPEQQAILVDYMPGKFGSPLLRAC